jgi:hypothetical protein
MTFPVWKAYLNFLYTMCFWSDWYVVSRAVYVLGFLVTIYFLLCKKSKPQDRPARNASHMVWDLADIFNIVHLPGLSTSQHFWGWIHHQLQVKRGAGECTVVGHFERASHCHWTMLQWWTQTNLCIRTLRAFSVKQCTVINIPVMLIQYTIISIFKVDKSHVYTHWNVMVLIW